MDACLRRSPDFFSAFVDQHHEFLAAGQSSLCHALVIRDRRVNDASLARMPSSAEARRAGSRSAPPSSVISRTPSPGPRSGAGRRAPITALAVSTSAVRLLCDHNTTVTHCGLRAMASITATHGTSAPSISAPLPTFAERGTQGFKGERVRFVGHARQNDRGGFLRFGDRQPLQRPRNRPRQDVLDVDTSLALGLSGFDGRECRPGQVIPGVDDAIVAQVAVQELPCHDNVQIKGGSEQGIRIGSPRNHRIKSCTRRTARAGALGDQLVHLLHYRDVGLAVEAVAPGVVMRRPDAIALVPTA